MNAQHTPGPWSLDCGALAMGGQIVATSIAPDTAGTEEAAANMRLIAAAPELLTALRLLTEKGTKQATGLGWNKRLTMARATIAKATGGAL